MTVGELKELIKDLPNDATVHAYEGEGTGIVIRTKVEGEIRKVGKELVWVPTDPA